MGGGQKMNAMEFRKDFTLKHGLLHLYDHYCLRSNLKEMSVRLFAHKILARPLQLIEKCGFLCSVQKTRYNQ